MSKYLFLVDESGDAGIDRIRNAGHGGASPYMTLGGVLIAYENIEYVRNELNKIHARIGKQSLHCSQLRHFPKLYFAKSVSRLPITAFGLISYKHTLGGYKEAIEGDYTKFYNACARYLLECLGEYMSVHDIKSHQVDIIFEEANFAYDSLRNYISICQDRPMGKTPQQLERVKLLRHLSTKRIIAKKKDEELLLQLPDLIAHGIYKCIDKTDRCFSITEPRYLDEISNLFYAHHNSGQIIGKGIKPVHNLTDLNLDTDILDFFRNLRVNP